MKKTFISIFALSGLLAASSASAAYTWYMENSPANIVLGDSFGTAGDESNKGLWYRLNGEDKVYIQGGYISSEDSIVIGDGVDTNTHQLTLDYSTTFANVTLNGTSSWNASAMRSQTNNEYSLNVTQNIFTYGNNTALSGFDRIIVGGNITRSGANFSMNTTKFIQIGGNVTGGANFYTGTFGSIKARTDANDGSNTFENGIANPDTIIKGYVANTKFHIKNYQTYDSYTQVGGIADYTVVTRDGIPESNNSVSYLILANKENYSTRNEVSDRDPEFKNFIPANCGSLHLVMKGDANAMQSFTSRKIRNSGGTTVISGSLRYNFNQDSSLYLYYTDSAKTVKVTAWTAEGASGVQTTMTHGDLRMRGGDFGATPTSTESATTYGAFRFKNIKYSAGEIKLRLDGEIAKCDTIDLTSYYLKTEDPSTGTSYQKVEGGTIALEEGVADTTKVMFNFGSNLDWLTEFDESDNGVKIVSWEAATTLSENNFGANNFNKNEIDYIAKFFVGNDGLYVKYVAVAEPSTIAAIFGVLALAFAAYRRRK